MFVQFSVFFTNFAILLLYRLLFVLLSVWSGRPCLHSFSRQLLPPRSRLWVVNGFTPSTPFVRCAWSSAHSSPPSPAHSLQRERAAHARSGNRWPRSAATTTTTPPTLYGGQTWVLLFVWAPTRIFASLNANYHSCVSMPKKRAYFFAHAR